MLWKRKKDVKNDKNENEAIAYQKFWYKGILGSIYLHHQNHKVAISFEQDVL